MDVIEEKYFNLKLANKPDCDFKQRRLNKRSEAFFAREEALSSILVEEDFVRSAGLFKGVRYRGFHFDSVRSHKDPTWGKIYAVYFHANRLGARFTGDAFTKSFSGVLHISKTDFAIVYSETKLERKLSELQRWVKKYYPGAASWNIYPALMVHSQRTYYFKSDLDGKYYTRLFSSEWKINGMSMRSKRDIELRDYYRYRSLGGPEIISNPSSIPFDSFKDLKQIGYDAAFWNSFVFTNFN
jgi:hypothetical protein